ncbi:MAG TPA: VCBS repeat-containing protein, partial [Urbifossiella sp.]|nr:VCBS repeat-containing protein [Urbifossiella sp.]
IGIADSSFRGGARAAVTDVNADGRPDLIVAAGLGGGPRIAVYNGTTVTTGSPTRLVNDFFVFDTTLRNGVYVAGGDVNGDGSGDVVFGGGPGAGPRVLVASGLTLTQSGPDAALAAPLANFFAGSPNSRAGVPVNVEDLNSDGKADVIAGGFVGAGGTLTAYSGATVGTTLNTLFNLAAAADVGATLAGLSLPTVVTPPVDPPPASTDALVILHLNPLDINLLGLEIDSSPITVTVSVEQGSGKLLGNALTIASNLVNLPAVSDALNNVLAGVVNLLNTASLAITETVAAGEFTSSPTGIPDGTVTSVLSVHVAPVHLNLLGAVVTTSPIDLTIQARTGSGLVLGNVLTALANLFNPPLPDALDLDFINTKLGELIAELDRMVPISATISPPPPIPAGSDRILQLVVAPIDLNLLGLNLQTDQINVNADAITGNGQLLGNVLTTLLNTLNATPENLTTLSNNINALLAKVVGILNAAILTLQPGAVESLAPVLGYLTSFDLVTAAPGASVPVLDLSIASPDGTTPPVDVNLLGLNITTSNINATLTATTGDGEILGNLVYNVSHLLDPDGSLNLLGVLGQLSVL